MEKKKQRGIFLMAHARPTSIAERHRRLSRRRTSKKSLLRFITCGSVDDGKSTLIGRLLYDSKMIFEDQLAALEADSKKVGTQGGEIDFALLVDGLEAEREQGITIDVAYRFFSTDKRKFIVADTPGHEQYTRNMVTGASTADLAVILIDARKGVLTQTRRHWFLVSLLGIRHVVLAVNKMDLVGYDQARLRPHRRRLPRLRRRARPCGHHCHPDLGPEGRQHHQPPAPPRPGTPGPTLMAAPGDGRDRRGPAAGPAVPHAGAVGEPPQPRLPRLRRHDRLRASCGPATGCASCRRAARAASRRIVTMDGDLDRGRRRPVGDPDPDDEIDCHPRRRDLPPPTRRPRSPTSSRPPSSGWPTSRCCPAAPTG